MSTMLKNYLRDGEITVTEIHKKIKKFLTLLCDTLNLVVLNIPWHFSQKSTKVINLNL